MTFKKKSKRRNRLKIKGKLITKKAFISFLFILTFFGLIFGIQSNHTHPNNYKGENITPPDLIDIFPKASVGPTIENLTETDPLEFGEYANVTVDVNHTANGVDTVLIELAGTNYTMTYVSGNEYNHTWQPSAVGTESYTIYANDSVGGEWSSLSDSIFVQDTTSPGLSNLNEFSGDPVEYNGAIEIRIDATDLLLDAVWIVFDGYNYTMSPVSGDTFSYSNGTLGIGTYSYTVYANDTSSNLATSASGDISVVDTTGPSLTNLNEFSGDPVEYNNAIEIRIDATDLLLDAVWIVFDGENYTMSPVSGDTYSYSNSSLGLGTYVYRVYANDTTGNLASSAINDITVEDSTAPSLTSLNEFSGDPVEYNGAIEIRIDTTDLLLDDVWIVFDGYNYTMSPVSGDTFSYTNASLALGTYTYRIYANDTSSNLASTASGDITVHDSTAPNLTSLNEFSGDPVEYNGAIEIRVDATDLLLDVVWIVFDGENYTMSPVSGDTYSYSNSSLGLGTYVYRVYANDTSGNLASTASGDITVHDSTAPNLTSLNEFSGDPVEYNGAIEIRVDATDLLLSTVWIVFDGYNYTMSPVSGDTFSYTNASLGLGTYSYTVYANDTSGNLASTASGDITVEDSTAPNLTNLNEFSGDPVEYNGAIEIRVDATDLLLSTVWIVFDGYNYTMSPVSGDTFSYTNSSLGLGTYVYQVYANDTSGNLASTASGDITVEDSTAPNLTNLNEFSGDPVEYNGVIEIRVDATDLLLGTVWIVFDGQNYTMSPVSGDTFSYSNGTLGVGTYTYIVYANDTTGNLASLASTDITVEDTTAPTISNVVEVSGDPTELGSNVYIRVNVSDLSTIDDVIIEFDNVNYTMIYISNDMYYYSNGSVGLGTYNYAIYANDTYGNSDSLLGLDIEVSDVTPPIMLDLVEVNGDPTEYDGDIYIRINVSHPSYPVDEVWIEFDGTNYSMTYLSGNMYYYTANYGIGTYTYTIYSNTSIGVEGSNGPHNIEVADTTGPSLLNLVEVSGDPVEFGNNVYIRANVTDLSTIYEVWIRFSGTNYSMTYINGDMYYFEASLSVGVYTYWIYANDTYGNFATRIGDTITVEDTIAPSLDNLVEVSGDPVPYNTSISLRVNATDLSSLDSVWINIEGSSYDFVSMGGDMYNYSGIHTVGVQLYTIYANDTYGNIQSITGNITVLEYVQSMIIFDISDYPVSNLTADTDFLVILPFDDNSTLDWAKVYFKIESGPQAAAPIGWTAISLVNGQATINSTYFDGGEILSYYFEIKDTYGVIFYVSSNGISTSNTTAQPNAFSFHITPVIPSPFEFPIWAYFAIGGLVALVAVSAVVVSVRKAKSKREILDIQGAEEAVSDLIYQQKSIQKDANRAERDRNYDLAVDLYQKLIVIANELFKFGHSSSTSNLKTYKSKIARLLEKAQKSSVPGRKVAVQQNILEYQKMASEAENTGDFETALVVNHQILMLQEEIRDKTSSSTRSKIQYLIGNIPNIREISATILKAAEEKYQAGDYQTTYSDYQYLKTIFEALGDQNLINHINKLISDVKKHL